MESKTPSLSQTSPEGLLKKKIELVENSVLGVESKLDLILLILDKKQGAKLGGLKTVESEKERIKITEEFTKKLAYILELLRSLNLRHKIVKELSNDDGVISFSVLTSKDRNILNEFIKADKRDDEKTFGLIVGYPSTAVETYHTDGQFRFRQELSPDEIAQLRAEGVSSFIRFMPSREHWTEELEFAREEQRLIREKAPKLYEEVLRELK